MSTACTPGEQVRLAALPPAARGEAFLTTWTLKEAYLKGRGEGLSRQPRAIAVDLEADGRAVVSDPSRLDAAGWRLRLLDAGPGWVAALAVVGCEPSITVFRWPAASDRPGPTGNHLNTFE
jgi:4'-phosphopantetheinyl transferase